MDDILPPITVRSVTSPNTLYYGDNLDIMREHIADESVDSLVYLDPPFNSGPRDYNVLFKQAREGRQNQAQITAFTDTWQWNTAAETGLPGAGDRQRRRLSPP